MKNGPSWFNFHTHSYFCDGKGAPAEYVTQALANGMASLGFSSHAPVPFYCSWCMKPADLNNYLSEIDQVKTTPGIEIYKSLEIDYIPGIISPFEFSDRLDYTIGSIHFTDAFADGTPWEIDGPHLPFLEGLASVFNNNMKAAVSRYFELTREMVLKSAPTIVGHIDKIKIQNKDDKFFRESDTWYQDEVVKTLNDIKSAGSIIEINTRGIYQKKSPTAYPSPWIIDLIHKKNIPVTISSDAHHPSDLINQFSETAALLKKTGIEKLHVLHNGSWNAYDYTENGILTERR